MIKNSSSFEIKEISDKVVRRDYSKIKYDFKAPDLLDVQIKSFQKFLDEEMRNVISSVFPITSPQEKYTLKFDNIELLEPRRSEEEARNEGQTYEAPLYVELSLVNNVTGEVVKARKTKKNQHEGIFFANVPLMTTKGTFIINGIEKFVIAQIIRSPGAYILSKSQIKLNNSRKRVQEGNICEVLPSKGTLMLSLIPEGKDYVQIMARDSSGESAPMIMATTILKAFGLSNEEIRYVFREDSNVEKTLDNEKYNYDNILNEPDIQLILHELAGEFHEDDEDSESREKTVLRGSPIEFKLKNLLIKYWKYKDVIDQLTFEIESLEEGTSVWKEKMDTLGKNRKIVLSLLDSIICEKAAKDVVNELNISIKAAENNTAMKNEACYQALLWQHFFHKRYYDITSAGRYKFNRKLRISERLYQRVIAEDIKDVNGVIQIPKDTMILKPELDVIKNMTKLNLLDVVKDLHLKSEVNIGVKDIPLRYESVLVYKDNEKQDETTPIIGVEGGNVTETLTLPDLVSIVSYVINLQCDIGDFDDIDHLGNKRLKLIHELIKNRIQVGILRIEKFIKEKLAVADGANKQQEEDKVEGAPEVKKKTITVKSVINTKPFQLVLKDFFNSHQLTQFIDQQNPLAELTNKRRISAMGPGGISREDPNLDIRDVHYSHYGRICPIETPEGMNIGLIMSLASFTRIDQNGFLITPYRVVKNGVILDRIKWLTALQDDEYIISESNVNVDEKGKILDSVIARYRGISDLFEPSRIDFIDVLPRQVVSIAASSIPFLENNDANRALMGANMQRQATPLMKPYSPIVGTGSEYKIAHDSGMAIISQNDGKVTKVDGKQLTVSDGENEQVYKFMKYNKSNQDTCNNQAPIVSLGSTIKKGDTLADGPAMRNGELSLGQNMLVAFTTWSGYNYEDAIILSSRLVKEDTYTSIHIDEHTIQCLVTKNGDEEITRDIPNVSEQSKKYLDEDGIIMVGAEVREGDILVGKITPKAQVDLSPEEKLLQAIFGEKTKQIKENSLKVAHGGEGIVAAVKRFRNSDEKFGDLGDDVIEVIKVYVVQKRKIQIGDKMAGRHGNKGIISKIVPIEDMPHMEDGTPIDVMLNPLGVPSRMNIGQILEIHLGLAARQLGQKELIRIAMTEKDHKNLIKLFGLIDSDAKYLYEATKKYIKEHKCKTLEEAYEKIRIIDIQIILSKVGLHLDDLGYKVSTPVFEGCSNKNLRDIMVEAGIDPIKTKGKFKLIDGRTGESFDGPISVGVMYMLKLDHMVDDKIHSRAVGPYSKITQQPLGGKSQNGGQRFGEMEVWALEAYGAAHNLREILTIKSDDVKGRNQTYNNIIKGKDIPEAGMPESFKLLTKQLQGLCLYVNVIKHDDSEVDINEFTKYKNVQYTYEKDSQIEIPVVEKVIENNTVVSDNDDNEEDSY